MRGEIYEPYSRLAYGNRTSLFQIEAEVLRDGKNRKVKIMLRYEWIYRKPEKNK